MGTRQGRVVVADIEGETAQSVAKELEAAGTEAIAVQVDVSEPASVEALAVAALERFGAVHVLVNNAAVAGQFGRTWASSLAEWTGSSPST